MLEVAVLVALCLLIAPGQATTNLGETFDNCAFLGNSRLQVSWTVRANDSEIDFQLCGCSGGSGVGATNTNEYMAFGMSGDASATVMFEADVTVAYVDQQMGPIAKDYYLSGYVQCRGGVGACPDTLDSSGTCTNDVSNVAGFRTEGFQCVSFTRSLSTEDNLCDIPIDPTNQQEYIVWAVGGMGETAFKHFDRAARGDPPIHLGREPSNACRGGLICPNCPPFQETTMDATGRDESFVANIGPPGNQRGYMAIADQAGWGIAWYINSTLIPHIMVERGFTYTFISEGGMPSDGQNYHPFYISNSRRGGRLQNSAAQQARETVFAGFDAQENSLGVGPYCELDETTLANNILNTCGPQEDYIRHLQKLQCSSSATPGRFTWKPDRNTPNIVYYQCATHLNLGYKISVMPPLDAQMPPTDGAQNLAAYIITSMVMVLITFAL